MLKIELYDQTPPPPIPPSLPLSPDDPLNQLQSHSTDVDKQNVLVDSMDPNCPKITEGFSQMKGLLKTPKINKWAECDQSYWPRGMVRLDCLIRNLEPTLWLKKPGLIRIRPASPKIMVYYLILWFSRKYYCECWPQWCSWKKALYYLCGKCWGKWELPWICETS